MELYLSDFERFVRGDDDGLAVQEALRHCRDGDVLHLDKPRLQLWPRYAARRDLFVSNNDAGPHAVAFYLHGLRHFTVDGGGAELLFHGSVTPFVVEGCEDITLENFAVDYRRPNYFQARIAEVGDGWFTLDWDEDEFCCTVQDDTFVFSDPETGAHIADSRVLAQEFDPEKKAPVPFGTPYFAVLGGRADKDSFLAGMYRFLSAGQTGPHTMRLTGELGFSHREGDVLVMTPGGRRDPGIVLSDTCRTLIRRVKLYHTASMGIVGQLSHDITLDGVEMRVRPGSRRVLSTQADATHFVNCTGTVEMKNCVFLSMMDDASNIHGIYTSVDCVPDGHTLLLRFGHYQQYGQLLYRPGDRVRLLRRGTLEKYAEPTVESARLLNGEFLYLTVRGELGGLPEAGDVAENTSRMPAVHIDGCLCGDNRPRGFLLTTCRPVVVENCEFRNMNSAIECAGDASTWFESGPVQDVLIRHNRFVNSAYAGGPVISLCPALPAGAAGPYHRNVRITGNLFRLHEKRFLAARAADGLVFSDNVYEQNPALPSHPFGDGSGFLLENCTRCTIDPPRENVPL